jgi:ABC-type antimicrobial peptide transport system permease subunit
LIFVRSALSAPETERLVSDAFAEVAPTIPFNRVETLSDAMRGSISGERLLARVLGTFAALAAVLAGIGLYGVVAYSVARRKREIGIRISLGASGRTVVGLVTRQGMVLVTAGVLLGAVGGYMLSRALASQLFGVTLVDPITYGLAIAGFAIVAGAACAIPARAATRLNPVSTLKSE